MKTIDLSKYGIVGAKEIIYNPSYEELFEAETNPALEGYEKGQVTELGAVNVMTGVYTGRSPKDKFIVMDENSKDTVWWTSEEFKNDNHPCSEETWKELKEYNKEEVDIVDVVGTYIPLTPKGKNYWAVCPFHNDSNPSMSVSREKKFFKCFSCGTSGNVIAFVQKYEHIPYYEAAAKLAGKIGIEIEEFDTPEYRRNKQYYMAMDETNNFYQFYLNNTAEGLIAKSYLEKRNIGQDLIDKFQIGLAPSSSNYLHKALSEKNIGLIEQIDLGLVRENNNGEPYDTFRNRIIFPLSINNSPAISCKL